MEHVRIDESLKRGPRHKHKPVKPRPADLGSSIVPPDLDPAEVLQRYLTHSATSQIAASYGISRKALTLWLREKCPEAWRKVQALRALMEKEDSTEEIREARDALALARARELLRGSQWDLERLDADFRPQQDVVHHAAGPLIQINVAKIAVGATVGATEPIAVEQIVDNQSVK